MSDKVPSYIEFTPHMDGNYTAKDNDGSGGSGGGGGCDLTSYMEEDCTKNRDHNARDCGNWRGGEDTTRAVSSEDLDALKRMVRDMLSNPELLHMSPLYSGIVGGVLLSSIQDENIMKEASYGAAAVSQASPSSFSVECEASFMPVTCTAATRLTMPMSPYFFQECNCSTPPPPPRRTSPKRTVTIPPLPFHP